MHSRRRRRWRASVGIAIAAAIGVAASVNAAAGTSKRELSCPAGTPAMVQKATYSNTGPVEGFDSPEEAVDYFVTTVYPGMPPGQFKSVGTDRGKVELASDHAHASAIELDRLVPNSEQTELVLSESGTDWVLEEFAICESNARRWATR